MAAIAQWIYLKKTVLTTHEGTAIAYTVSSHKQLFALHFCYKNTVNQHWSPSQLTLSDAFICQRGLNHGAVSRNVLHSIAFGYRWHKWTKKLTTINVLRLSWYFLHMSPSHCLQGHNRFRMNCVLLSLKVTHWWRVSRYGVTECSYFCLKQCLSTVRRQVIIHTNDGWLADGRAWLVQ